MKKIIAVLLSFQLVGLSIQPAFAQQLPSRKLASAVTKASKGLPAGLRTAAGQLSRSNTRLLQLDNTLLKQMRLPLSTQYTGLLANQSHVPVARQILTHSNAAERALLLRTDFTALALQNKVSLADKAEGAAFYRENLQHVAKNSLPEIVADIASLGLLGEKQDGALILKVARQFIGTPQEAAVTAASARALLRLEAYEQLVQLDDLSRVQPELWEGMRTYAKTYQLPVRLFQAKRKTVDTTSLQTDLMPLGPINSLIVNPSEEVTFLYMNAGKGIPPLVTQNTVSARKTETALEPEPEDTETPIVPLQMNPLSAVAAAPEAFSVLPEPAFTPAEQELAALVQENAPKTLSAPTQSIIDQTKAWLARLSPKSADETMFSQRAALYLTAFSIGLEIGTPIMASIKSALNLPLSFAVLVTAATYAPYLFGSFIANWVKSKLGRKGTMNTGLGLMAGSFTLGATALGFDGSFTAWENPVAQYLSLLGVLTAASTGAVFIQNAAGPVMTEISNKASDLVRQQRGTYIELSRSIGMMASFAFPYIATRILGMDWSAPFLLALPVVGASALALNLAKLPNSKQAAEKAPMVTNRKGKTRSANSYIHLLRDAPGVGSFISGLFVMNGVEVAINSGFLFLLPQLTGNESERYLLGMIQFSVAFLLGRMLAKYFLKWFPNRNVSVATLLAAASSAVSLAMTSNIYALTAALFTTELGISTTFTLAYARTAKDPATQDKITSLIMASAVACALGPLLLTEIAQSFMNMGILNEADATVAALIGIPTVLALLSAKLFSRMESKMGHITANGTNWKTYLKQGWEKLKALLHWK